MNDSERKHEIFCTGDGKFRYRLVTIKKFKSIWKAVSTDISIDPDHISKLFKSKHTKRSYLLNDIDLALDGNAVTFITEG